MSRLEIFPVGPFGSSVTTKTWRGYLYGASCSRANALTASGSRASCWRGDDQRHDLFAVVVVRDAHHRRLEDARQEYSTSSTSRGYTLYPERMITSFFRSTRNR